VRTALKLGLRVLSVVLPGVAAKIATRLWFRVAKPPVSQEAQQVLGRGARSELRVDDTAVVAWRWGTGPAVLLVHGWGGYAGQLHAFVEPLTRAGCQVVAFDAPSHGESGPSKWGARQATLFEFAEAMVAASRDATRIAGVIAHSGGCAAVAWALRTHGEWRPGRVVFIAPFGNPARYMDIFQRSLGFTNAVMDRFRANTERMFDFRWAEFAVPRAAQVVKTPPVLVIHDRDDRETMWQDGADIAASWPDATLHTTTGLGHNRILRDAATVDLAVRFVTQASLPT